MEKLFCEEELLTVHSSIQGRQLEDAIYSIQLSVSDENKIVPKGDMVNPKTHLLFRNVVQYNNRLYQLLSLNYSVSTGSTLTYHIITDDVLPAHLYSYRFVVIFSECQKIYAYESDIEMQRDYDQLSSNDVDFYIL